MPTGNSAFPVSYFGFFFLGFILVLMLFTQSTKMQAHEDHQTGRGGPRSGGAGAHFQYSFSTQEIFRHIL